MPTSPNPSENELLSPPAVTQADSADSGTALAALKASESDALFQRRREVLGLGQLCGPPTQSAIAELNLPKVGLALSGGGIRSATFALGLLRGMAQSRSHGTGTTATQSQVDLGTPKGLASAGLLGRLDFLSSVSGGGYTAAMFGRLVHSFGLHRAQDLLAQANSSVLDWLRRNGRYLTPAGSRDIGIAVVTFLRAWIAIHAEFMIACLALGLVVTVPHLWQHTYQLLDPVGWEQWRTPWWALAMAFWLATAPGLIAGYWSARDSSSEATQATRIDYRDVTFLLVAVVCAYLLLHALVLDNTIDPLHQSLNWPAAGALALISLVLGQLAARGWLTWGKGYTGLRVAQLRNWLTRMLRWAMMGALILGSLGALDRLSWWLLEEFLTGRDYQLFWSSVGAGGIALVALRTLMQPLQKIAADSNNQARKWLPQLLNIVSLLGMLVLVTAWLVLLQWFIFAPDPFKALIGVPAWTRAGLLLAVWLTWVVLTAGNAQMANTSSLHSFYRARLTRAYLAVGNPERGFNQPGQQHDSVTQVVDGDDLRLRDYRPELKGGPIHLVNTCLNQTRDDQSGLYNADRKGTAVTASWRGFEVGKDDFIKAKFDLVRKGDSILNHDLGTLGRWVAVSGAAASPGAGAYTSRGLALLVYFLGVRLGHWMRSPKEVTPLKWLSHWSWKCIPKPMMLASEASATFFGKERPWWYLSDGGHFENSAVYPLLKREVDFIVLSDASGDVDYDYGDIENLVRKARIDFSAEIDFYSRSEASSLFSLSSAELTVVSPEDLANNHSCRGVLLARIRYRERAGPPDAQGRPGKPFRPEGTLLVIKPNLHDALDVDLLAYAQKHTSFPHESTGDQSFDEAQWESYHRLGEDFGRALHDSWLAQLPGWRSTARHPLKIAARLASARDAVHSQKTEPLWRRSARAAAIGTTLGLGASGTVLLSLWQMMEQQQRETVTQQTALRARFTEATKDLEKSLESVKDSCPVLTRPMVTQAMQMLELRGIPALQKIDQLTVTGLAERVENLCLAKPDVALGCAETRAQIQPLCVRALSSKDTSAMNYWQPCGSAPLQGKSPGAKTPRELRLECRQALEANTVRVPDFVKRLVTNEQNRASELAPTTAVGSDAIVELKSADKEPATSATGTATSPPNTVAQPNIANDLATSPAAPPSTLKACFRDGVRTTLYIHIYDESSRTHTRKLRKDLQGEQYSPVIVAPVENVTRSADLRQQRKPVPWPKPTLLLHDRNNPQSRECATAIANYIGAPWVLPMAPGALTIESRTVVRDLPSSMQSQPGVIELWLPPTETSSPNVAQGREYSANSY